MSWLESQIETRERLDSELVENAYAKLAASVTDPSRAPRFSVNDLEQADGAVKTCLRYNGVIPGQAPDGMKDVDERIEWICRPSGTMHRRVRLDDGWYKRAFGALLGRLDTGEAVALLPRGVRGYFYHEPGTGRKIRVTSKVAQRIDSEALLFYRPLPPKPLKVRDLVSFVFATFDRNDYLLVVAAALVVALIGLLPAWANNIAFGTVVPSGQVGLILPVGALLMGVMVSAALFGACRNLVMTRITTKVGVTSEAAVFSRVLMLPADFFKSYPSGALASRVASVSHLVEALSSALMGTGLTSLFALLYIVQIGFYAPALSIPALLILVIQLLLTVAVTFLTMGYESATLTASTRLSGIVTALLNGVQKIKLAGAEDRAFAKWAHQYAEYANAAYNRPAFMRALPAFVTVVGLIGMAVLYYLAATTGVSVAEYMAFSAAYGQVNTAVMLFANSAETLATIKPQLDEIAPILESVPEVAEEKPNVGFLNGAIDVNDVSFRYGADASYVVKNLSFTVRPGEYVALVGKSGCGKSTILRLLLGFEKPEKGTIFYGPYDATKVNLNSLRKRIGSVMQNSKLFMGDIYSNITVSAPMATLDDAWAAAEVAGIADDIRKMPMGMHTLVTEGGGGVSGGQRQRIMIARAVCGGRKILMFDEATSALDNVTQKHVSDALGSLKCTRIVVAHRLSTVKHCDRILVVDGGAIAEEGTYDGLIAKGGLFAELVARQRLDAGV